MGSSLVIYIVAVGGGVLFFIINRILWYSALKKKIKMRDEIDLLAQQIKDKKIVEARSTSEKLADIIGNSVYREFVIEFNNLKQDLIKISSEDKQIKLLFNSLRVHADTSSFSSALADVALLKQHKSKGILEYDWSSLDELEKKVKRLIRARALMCYNEIYSIQKLINQENISEAKEKVAEINLLLKDGVFDGIRPTFESINKKIEGYCMLFALLADCRDKYMKKQVSEAYMIAQRILLLKDDLLFDGYNWSEFDNLFKGIESKKKNKVIYFNRTINVIKSFLKNGNYSEAKNNFSVLKKVAQDPLYKECLGRYNELKTEIDASTLSKPIKINKTSPVHQGIEITQCFPSSRTNARSRVQVKTKPLPILLHGDQLKKRKSNWQQINSILRKNGVLYFYHFTDKRNLNSIKKHGGLFSWSYCLKHNIRIDFPGGSDTSRSLDQRYNLQNFVRLSFCNDHPMMYRLEQDGFDLVLLKIKADVAFIEDTKFSDINAADGNHILSSDVDNIHFDATRQHYLRRDDAAFKYHQAEILVREFVPLNLIVNFNSVYSEYLSDDF